MRIVIYNGMVVVEEFHMGHINSERVELGKWREPRNLGREDGV